MSRVSSHGQSIYYERLGEGDKTLIFAHGMGGNGAIWYQQLAHFAGQYSVVTFDHRYFGRSACSPDDFRPEWFADDVMAIMEAEAISSATFICQSMGGWTGSQMAVHHADKVDALVMSHTPGIFTVDDANYDPRQTSQKVSEPPRAGFGNAALAADFPEKNPAGALLYNQISGFNDIDPGQIPRAIARAGIAVDVTSLKTYAVPTLFISAEKDDLFPCSYIEAVAQALPGAQYINLGDAGHSSYFELPEAFNQTVADFLAAQAG